MNQSLTPAQRRKLIALNARVARVLGFDMVPRRDPQTGAFTTASHIHPQALRAAWGVARQPANSQREAFKRQLLAAIRNRSQK